MVKPLSGSWQCANDPTQLHKHVEAPHYAYQPKVMQLTSWNPRNKRNKGPLC